MTLPGPKIILRDIPPPLSAPGDTTTWFAAGLAAQGPSSGPLRITSMADFTRLYGARQTYSILYDALDMYFREGGASAWIARVVGPAATTGFKNLNDNVAAISLVVSALGPGAYSSGIFVGVVAGSTGYPSSYQIQITDGVNILEQSGDLATQADAVNWSQQSQYVRITLGASALIPIIVAPAAMSAGTDDRANITETQWTNALALFSKALGPGQVSMPGRTTDTAHTNLLAHAFTNNRIALLDAVDTPTVATLTAAVVACRIGNQRWGAVFAPWLSIPGIVPNTVRTVPPSSLVAGLIARNEGANGSNSPSAGNRGISRYAIGLTQPGWTDAQRDTLNTGGVNVILNRFGNIEVYGWRSLVDPVLDSNWLPFGNSRLYMEIATEAAILSEQFEFSQIDGQGHTISAFNGALTGMLLQLYNQGELFGATAQDAFYVDTGAQVNTPITMAANELHALLNVRMSPFAEIVQIEVVKTPVTQAVV